MFPTVDLRFDLRGINKKIKEVIGEYAQPQDYFQVENTAQDGEGNYYFHNVNDGTGPKEASRNSMVFFAEGRVVHKKLVAGNPPVHMTERVIPLLKAFFLKTVKEETRSVSGSTKALLTNREWDRIMQKCVEYAVEELEKITPVISEKYYAEGFTPEPGLLKKSYRIRRRRRVNVQG
jgi:hypothetical protein